MGAVAGVLREVLRIHASWSDASFIDVELDKLVLVNFAWVTRPEQPEDLKDELKRTYGQSVSQ